MGKIYETALAIAAKLSPSFAAVTTKAEGTLGRLEAQAAKLLGVAQAAISKYITGKCSDRLKGKAKGVEARTHAKKDLIDGYIKEISEGREEYVNICICTFAS